VAKDENAKHECVYVGPHEITPMEPLESAPATPSYELARSVSLSVLGGDRGSIKSLPHFVRRCKQRSFDVFDVEYTIRNGECVKSEYCPDFQSHKYTFRCLIDGVEFDAAFALSAKHDLIKAPLLYLISGCWKTETGSRAVRY
jgi:hypothetical protein